MSDGPLPFVAAPPATRQRGWRAAYWVLWACLLLTAVLNLARVRGGFLTGHCADLTVPALLYVVARRYPPDLAGRPRLLVRRLVGTSPERAAALIFFASAATEISQRFWPHGLFRGTWDPLDLLAYSLSVLACYAADRRAIRRASGVSVPRETSPA